MKKIPKVLKFVGTKGFECRLYLFNRSNKLRMKEYLLNGKRNRSNNLPAIEAYYLSGARHYVTYYNNNIVHKEFDPAFKSWHKNGNLNTVSFYVNGKEHNEFGPARMSFDEGGNLYSKEFYLNGDIDYFLLYISCFTIKTN